MDFYGASAERVTKLKKANRPKPKDFGLPKLEEELNSMMSEMASCGFDKLPKCNYKDHPEWMIC